MRIEFETLVPFERWHLAAIDYNEWVDGSISEAVTNDPQWGKATLLNVDKKPVLVICFKGYARGCWEAYIVADKAVTKADGVELRKNVEAAAERYKADRIYTISLDDRRLNLWHRLLGFNLEGVHPKMLGGKTCNTWGRTWEWN